MFGPNDKNQANNQQQNNNQVPAAVPVVPAPSQDNNLVTPPPDPVIAPTAPPLNDSLSASAAEPILPPPPELPKIVTDASKNRTSSIATPPVSVGSIDAVDDELINIKQQALHHLAPLVNQLEQTPEERFKTTMMMIQASDNAALIKDAYDAANSISDEKARAQALLDVVNEINYFTQHQNQE